MESAAYNTVQGPGVVRSPAMETLCEDEPTVCYVNMNPLFAM